MVWPSKHAVVQPLLKKSNLNPSVPKNFWPISKLPFLAKVLEKVLSTQILDFKSTFDIFRGYSFIRF